MRGFFQTGSTAASALLIAMCFGCAPSSPARDDERDVTIEIQTDSLFPGTDGTGRRAELHGDGSVVLTSAGRGESASVAVIDGSVDPATVRDLVDEFYAVEFFDLDESYINGNVSDGTVTTTSITIDGVTTVVSDANDGGPDGLVDLEERIWAVAEASVL